MTDVIDSCQKRIRKTGGRFDRGWKLNRLGTAEERANDGLFTSQLENARFMYANERRLERKLDEYADNFQFYTTMSKLPVDPIDQKYSALCLSEGSCDDLSAYQARMESVGLLASHYFTREVDERTGKEYVRQHILPSHYSTKPYNGTYKGNPRDYTSFGPRPESMYLYYKYKAPRELHATPYYVSRREPYRNGIQAAYNCK